MQEPVPHGGQQDSPTYYMWEEDGYFDIVGQESIIVYRYALSNFPFDIFPEIKDKARKVDRIPWSRARSDYVIEPVLKELLDQGVCKVITYSKDGRYIGTERIINV